MPRELQNVMFGSDFEEQRSNPIPMAGVTQPLTSLALAILPHLTNESGFATF